MLRRRQVKWLAGGLSATLAATGATMMGAAPRAHADPSPGQGSASAQALAVAPHDGSLAVGVVLGEALAGHTNDVARAQSQGIDLGAIGTALTSYNCGSQSLKPDQIPQALTTETGDPGASKGVTQQPDPATGSNQPSYGSYEYVKANSTPYGEAETSFAPVNAGGFTVSAMTTKAWSGLVNGQREAGATADIGALDIANGLVKIDGLHWKSVYPSGGTAEPSGTFTIGSLDIAGKPVPVPAGQGLTALQNAINTVLGTLGIKVVLPVSSVQQGVQSVTPLQIEAVPNKTRDTILNLGLNATEAQQQQVLGGLENGFPGEPAQLAKVLCQSDTPITVAQVAIASVNGGGYLSAGLGGVTSSSSAVQANQYHLNLLGPISLGVGSGSSAPVGSLTGTSLSGAGTAPAVSATGASPSLSATGSAATPSAAPTAGAGTAAPSTGSGTAGQLAASPAAVSYSAGGPLLAIGIAGLGLIGLLAEADRRMMRRAQYTVNFEE